MATRASSSKPRRSSSFLIAALAPVLVVLAVVGTACEADDVDPSTSSIPGVPGGPGDGDDSTTSSLPGPNATAAPNPDAGGGGEVTTEP